MEHNGISYKVKVLEDKNFDDSTKIIFIDKNNNKQIGYISFEKEVYIDSFNEEIDGIEICDIVDEYNPMCLNYLEIYNGYKNMGFGTKLMEYFVANYMQDNICILLVSAFSITDIIKKQEFTEKILPLFYSKFGFKKIKDSNYMVANYLQ